MRRNKYLFVVGVPVVLVVSAFTGVGVYETLRGPNIEEGKYYEVSKVFDGDTFAVRVGDAELTVRMLGIDTPETVDPRKPIQCYGREASARTQALLAEQSVRLEYSPRREIKDKYGRYLVYVYLQDGLELNKSLIEDGYAREYTFGTAYSHQREYRQAQVTARSNKKGLWGQCDKK